MARSHYYIVPAVPRCYSKTLHSTRDRSQKAGGHHGLHVTAWAMMGCMSLYRYE